VNAARRALVAVDLGRVSYAAALAAQLDLVERIAAGEDDRLLLVEHEPVITCGRGTAADERASLAALPVDVVESSRGGEATWHGPGQLVGYPLLRLDGEERDLHRHLRVIEDALLAVVRDYGLEGTRKPPHTGVWIGSRKVASIGVAVKRWVSYHGFALNLDPDLAAFQGFKPCGLDGAVMTSLAVELGVAGIDRDEAASRVTQRVAEAFGRRLVRGA
jgi:lipoyl(octanoyl) transferase